MVARFEAFIVFCPVRCIIVVFSGSCLVAGCVFFFFFFFFFLIRSLYTICLDCLLFLLISLTGYILCDWGSS